MTILERLQITSNDYSDIETDFINCTNVELLTAKDFNPQNPLKSVSVVIPCFKSNHTLLFTLKSLGEQDFLKNQGKLEVIIVDDCSPTPLFDIVPSFDGILHITYIRFCQNLGAGKAREIGAKIANNDIVIFIDSDIILKPSFISNHVYAHQYVEAKSIMISFRENIHSTELNSLISRNPNPSNGDHRIFMKYKSEWVTKNSETSLIGKEFKLLADTDNFKVFGNYRQIEIWNLPLMVLTCAMSFKKEWALRYLSVPNELTSCYFDDTIIAAKMISAGAKVIPLYNSNVFHYLEDSHTRSNEIKREDYLKNEIIYLNLLSSEFYEG
jgi:glycosyltransferase involved in cell wall biosynthesis